MTWFFRWTPIDAENVRDFKAGVLNYTWQGMPSRKAFWVFELNSTYRPGRRIVKGRLLLAFDFGERGETVVKNPSNFVRFPSAEFKGETKHPTQIIVKDNERGAYGIGAMIFSMLPAKSIRLATKPEIAKALEVSLKEIDWTQDWPKEPKQK